MGELPPRVFGRLRTGGFDARQGEARAEGLRPAGPGATLHPERDTRLGTRILLMLADCKRMMRSVYGHVRLEDGDRAYAAHVHERDADRVAQPSRSRAGAGPHRIL